MRRFLLVLALVAGLGACGNSSILAPDDDEPHLPDTGSFHLPDTGS